MIKIIIVVIVTYLFSRDINVMLIGFNKKYRENTKLAIKRAETCDKMARNYWFNYHSWRVLLLSFFFTSHVIEKEEFYYETTFY